MTTTVLIQSCISLHFLNLLLNINISTLYVVEIVFLLSKTYIIVKGESILFVKYIIDKIKFNSYQNITVSILTINYFSMANCLE